MRRVAWVVAAASIAVAVSVSTASAGDPVDPGATSTPAPTTTAAAALGDESTGTLPGDDGQPAPATSEPEPTAPVTSDPSGTEAPVEEDPADTVAAEGEIPEPDAEDSTDVESSAPAPCGVYGTVAPGAPAGWVRCTESWLDFLGYDAGTVNGTFDGRTEAALRSFQSDEGIRVTGTGTPLAMTRLGIWSGASFARSCSVNRTVAARSSSWSAFCVEKRLAQLGYAVGQGKALDGPSPYLDPGSLASLRSFARARGVPWRGSATPLLLRELGIWSGASFAGSCRVNRTVAARSWSWSALCVEKRLAQLGYAVGQGKGLDGPSRWLDPGSLASLRSFARSRGVPWRGSATPLLLRELGIWSGASFAGSCTVSRTVRVGDVSNDGFCVEKRLAQLGFAVGQGKGLDGPSKYFDPGSGASLRAFQRNNGLVVDGVAGPATLSRLRIWKPPPSVTPAGSPVFAVGARQVALTFDDGPSSYTDQVLDVLARFDVPATFFLVGSAVDRGAAAVRRTYREGHSVQNHSWDHPSFTRLSDGSIQSQLNRTAAAIQRVTGQRSTCYRPPGGATSSRVRAAAAATGHYPEILWNVNPSDYLRPAPSVLVARSLGLAHGQGLIIGLHDGGGPRGNTVAALPDIIRGLKARGYRFVRLCD